MAALVTASATCLVVSASVLSNDLYAWMRDNRLSFTSIKQVWERVHDGSYHRFQQFFDAETWNNVVLPGLEMPGFVAFLALALVFVTLTLLRRGLRLLVPAHRRAFLRLKRYSQAEIDDMFARAKIKAQDLPPAGAAARPRTAFELDPHIACMDELFEKARIKQADMHAYMHQDNEAWKAEPDAAEPEARPRRRRWFSRERAAAA